MRYIDPSPVTCDRCSTESMQRVGDLLRLSAVCPGCGTLLKDVGNQMREGLDKWGEYCALCELTISLEEALGTTITDKELKGVQTLRELARIVEPHLSAGPDREGRAVALVETTARKVSPEVGTEVALDARLIDAIRPSRWLRDGRRGQT